ncbi:MAG: DoxX family protein, partial [Planctomycetota bacterium]
MASLFLSPFRLIVGWGISPRILGPIAVAMIVLLRLTIGWHFLSEGTEKYESGNWTAKPFFANAKGPLAGQFRQMVWDHDGALRLDRDRTMVVWATYRDRVGKHFGFDAGQAADAQRNYAKAVEQYDYVIELAANDLEEYQLGLGRIDELDRDPVRDGVTSLGGQRETVRRELSAKVAPTLSQIDAIWENYETSQNQLATDEQLQKHLP